MKSSFAALALAATIGEVAATVRIPPTYTGSSAYMDSLR